MSQLHRNKASSDCWCREKNRQYIAINGPIKLRLQVSINIAAELELSWVNLDSGLAITIFFQRPTDLRLLLIQVPGIQKHVANV